eukprot:sb/3473576/
MIVLIKLTTSWQKLGKRRAISLLIIVNLCCTFIGAQYRYKDIGVIHILSQKLMKLVCGKGGPLTPFAAAGYNHELSFSPLVSQFLIFRAAQIGPQNHQKIMTHSPICGSWVSGPRPFHMHFSMSRKPKNHLRRRVEKKSRTLECVASSH